MNSIVIAVAYDNGNIADLETAPEFKVYTPKDARTFACEMTQNPPEGNTVGLLLTTIGAKIVICNKISKESKEDLEDFDINVFDNVQGQSDMSVGLLARSALAPDMDLREMGHCGCGGHGHGEGHSHGHSHGSGGCCGGHGHGHSHKDGHCGCGGHGHGEGHGHSHEGGCGCGNH